MFCPSRFHEGEALGKFLARAGWIRQGIKPKSFGRCDWCERRTQVKSSILSGAYILTSTCAQFVVRNKNNRNLSKLSTWPIQIPHTNPEIATHVPTALMVSKPGNERLVFPTNDPQKRIGCPKRKEANTVVFSGLLETLRPCELKVTNQALPSPSQMASHRARCSQGGNGWMPLLSQVSTDINSYDFATCYFKRGGE